MRSGLNTATRVWVWCTPLSRVPTSSSMGKFHMHANNSAPRPDGKATTDGVSEFHFDAIHSHMNGPTRTASPLLPPLCPPGPTEARCGGCWTLGCPHRTSVCLQEYVRTVKEERRRGLVIEYVKTPDGAVIVEETCKRHGMKVNCTVLFEIEVCPCRSSVLSRGVHGVWPTG